MTTFTYRSSPYYFMIETQEFRKGERLERRLEKIPFPNLRPIEKAPPDVS
jgi:hypothetical protein